MARTEHEHFQTPLGIAADIDRNERPYMILAGSQKQPGNWEVQSCAPSELHIIGAAEAAVATIGNSLYGEAGVPNMQEFTREDQNLIAGLNILILTLMQTRSETFRKRLGGTIGVTGMMFASEEVQNIDELAKFAQTKAEELKK